jgi:hypothetical protein
LEKLGKIHFHGVAVNPAKPVLFAEIGDVPVIGLPGYPVAAFIAAFYYLQPFVTALSGASATPVQQVLISAEDLSARDTDYIHRVNIFDVDGRVYVRRISRGAGSARSLTMMDGLMHVPPRTAIHKRDAVRVDVIRDRPLNTVAVRGVVDSIVSRLIDLFHKELPGQRLLFWECPSEEALQNIIERNAHLAIISTSGSMDLFPTFANQLQDNMLRYRIFTRSVGLTVRAAAAFSRVGELPQGSRVAVPQKNLMLWNELLLAERISSSRFEIIPVMNDEEALANSLDTGHWDLIFADLRFLKARQEVVANTKEHIDLIVSEIYTHTPPIRKLIDLLMSEGYGQWIQAHSGCDIRSRGMLVEAPGS